MKRRKLLTSRHGVTCQTTKIFKNLAVRTSYLARTYSFFRTMVLLFPPFSAVRGSKMKSVIPFCKILFHTGIKHFQFKVELLSTRKRFSALWKFLKAGEMVTLPEIAIVIGKTIHYNLARISALRSAVSVSWNTSNTKAGSDLQAGLCIWMLPPTCCSKATNRQYFANKVLTTNVKFKFRRIQLLLCAMC